MQIDVSNAFNSISRAAILDSIWADYACIGKWVEYSLCHTGHLLTDSCTILSTNGVQQGDPLGPFLISAGIHRIISRLKHKYGATVQMCYPDDGVIAGMLSDLELFFNEMATEFRDIGLNRLKCKLFIKGDCSLTFVSAARRQRLEILGAPIGSDEFVSTLASSKIMKAIEFCERVAATVDDPQIAVAMCTITCHAPDEGRAAAADSARPQRA